MKICTKEHISVMQKVIINLQKKKSQRSNSSRNAYVWEISKKNMIYNNVTTDFLLGFDQDEFLDVI